MSVSLYDIKYLDRYCWINLIVSARLPHYRLGQQGLNTWCAQTITLVVHLWVDRLEKTIPLGLTLCHWKPKVFWPPLLTQFLLLSIINVCSNTLRQHFVPRESFDRNDGEGGNILEPPSPQWLLFHWCIVRFIPQFQYNKSIGWEC